MSEIPEPSAPLSPQAAQAALAALPKEQQSGTLAPTTFRNLIDRMYEKRKLGALEVESTVRVLAAAGSDAAVRKVIGTLSTDFVGSTQGNYKKGGLIALAAAAVALGPAGIGRYLAAIASPVLACMQDPDTRVRYYALESFYNVAKVARGGILVLFNNVFDSCCRLAADPDQSVRNASQLLDMLIKDIVTQQPSTPFDLARFVPLLKRRVQVTHPNARHFLITWLTVLDSVPDINIARHLPDFLDGLLEFLVDPVLDIRTETAAILKEFLKELVSQDVGIDIPALLRILIARCAQACDAARAARCAVSPSATAASVSAAISNSAAIVAAAASPQPLLDVSSSSNGPAAAAPVSPSQQQQQQQQHGLPSSDAKASNDKKASASAGATTNSSSSSSSSTTHNHAPLFPSTPNKQQQTQQQQGQQQQQQTGKQQQQPSWSAPTDSTGKNNEPIVFTVLEWLAALVECATKPDASSQTDFLSQGPSIVSVLLPLIAEDDTPLAGRALGVNETVLKFVAALPREKVQPFLSEYLGVAVRAIDIDSARHCRTTGFGWLSMLYAKFGEALLPAADRVFPPLLKSLADPADAILAAAARLGAAFSASDVFFEREMASLAQLFLTDTGYMRDRAAKIVRLLCTFNDAERIFMHLGRILVALRADTERTAETVQILNILLLSMDETRAVRRMLAEHASAPLFETLHRAWAYSPSSLFSLCLLSRSYTHAAAIVESFAEADVTLPFLLELDQIVQLFESPAFVQQRMQLLRPQQHPDLVRAMYGLLMVLPQSHAFALLKSRLSCATKFARFQALQPSDDTAPAPASNSTSASPSPEPDGYAPDYAGLLDNFRQLQRARAANVSAGARRIDVSLE